MRASILILILATLASAPSSSPSQVGKYRQFDVEIMQRALKREALNLKIKNLRDSVSKPGTEIRIWVGFGLLYPRCFIMTERNGKREAFHITAKGSSRRITTPKVSLESPRSGWNEFAEFIKKHGIDLPLKLSFDDEDVPDPDEEMIAIEIKSKRKYEMIFYNYSTTARDGRMAWDVCRKIDLEFGIRMGCPPLN